ncbi:flagellar MS-ring protein [Sphingorhabdus sp. M41]|nr:flagellar MS-ring protein [Sphingorhabdus sp. M41]
MEGLRNFTTQFGSRRLIIMAVVAVMLMAALAYVAVGSRASGQMGYLYTDLEPSSAQAIVEKLQTQDIPFELTADGTAVMVPREHIAELRMAMAGEQLGGKIGFEVLDEQQPFGISAARERLNETRAIQGELARSIATVRNISSARVHIVMPERALFAAEQRKASAAVTVKTAGRLSAENVDAIRYLVAASVPELSPDAISVVDQNGALLARAGEAGSAGSSMADERQTKVENRIRSQVESLLEPLVGRGKVRAEVTADIKRDQEREEAQTFDPDNQVIQRQISVEAGDQSRESQAGGAATVSEQLPDGGDLQGGDGDSRLSNSNETSEDTVYQNSSRNTVTIRAPGAINRLTVAVMLDTKSLPQERKQRLQSLVESAVGFNEERGDSVVIEAMPFAAPEEEPGLAESLIDNLPIGVMLDFGKLLLIAAVGLVALRMVRGKKNVTTALELSERRTNDPIDLTPHQPDGGATSGDSALIDARDRTAEVNQLEEGIELAQVEGSIKLSALKKIGATVQSSPAESASVIRQWMNA